MAGQAVYWIGQDGNVYLKAPQTDTSGTWNVTNMGPANGTGANGGGYPGAVQIADPNVKTTSPAPTPTSAPAAPKPVFNQAGATNTQATIDQLGPLLNAALQTEQQRYRNTMGDYGAQENVQRDTYGKSTTTNQQNYDANFMDSIRAGIHGLGGLMSLLRGTGAGGGGTAEDIARDTVGGVTAQDIRGGHDTQQENQTSLDSVLSSFLTDLQRKRQVAGDTLHNNESAVRRDNSTQLQDLYGKMAGFYGDVGDQANSNAWMARAGALTPEIAAASRTQLSNYDNTPIAVQAPQVTAFAGPTQPDVLAPPSDGQVGSGIFTMTDPRRRKEVAPTPVPVGV